VFRETTKRIARHDASSMLRTWRKDDVLIRCELRFRAVTAGLWSRVVAVSDTEVRFLDGDRGELVLTLQPFAGGHAIVPPSRQDVSPRVCRGVAAEDDLGEADAIVFAELTE
jgi:hypothetical protein